MDEKNLKKRDGYDFQFTASIPDRAFSMKSIAEILHISLGIVKGWFGRGEIRWHTDPGPKFMSVTRESLIEFMNGHNMPVELLEEWEARQSQTAREAVTA